MKTALVHEFLITWGGSDLVVQKFSEIYPDAPIFTALFDRDQIGDRFQNKQIITSFLQKFGFLMKKHRFAMPFFPFVFENFDLRGYDVVLSSHHCAAKSIVTGADTLHVCFVHTPMRYGWDFYSEYMDEFRPITRAAMRLLFHYMRAHDVVSSNRVDHYIANSRNVARRIQKHYRRESVVIPPPVDASKFRVSDKVDDYYFLVSRLVPYKRADVAVEAFNITGQKLLVAGTGPEMQRLKAIAKPNIEFLGFVSDADLANHYSRCRAFLFPGDEDFGITPLEAMASGRPVIAYASGGALETVVDGKTGAFFPDQNPASLAETLLMFDPFAFDPSAIRSHALGFDTPVFKQRIKTFVDECLEKHMEARA